MPGTKLVGPVVSWTGRAPPVSTREAIVRGGPSTSNRLVVPVLLRADFALIKEKKTKMKAKTQWTDYNRQAKRREKPRPYSQERKCCSLRSPAFTVALQKTSA